MKTLEVDFNATYRIQGHDGIAWLAKDEEGNEWEEQTGDGEWVDDPSSGRVRAVMVGDDHEWIHDITDLVILEDDEYCSCCGQIGCGWS